MNQTSMKRIMPIVLILISIGIFFLLIDPNYKKVKDLQVEVDANQNALVVAKKLESQRKDLQQKYTEISQDEKNKLEKLLPDTVDNVRLIIDIDNIAKKSGIVIRDININSDDGSEPQSSNPRTQGSSFDSIVGDNAIKYVDANKIGVISFSFSVSAKYDVFLEFLKQLEESLRIVDIRNIEITRTGTESVFYDYKVTMDTYWLK